MKNLIYLILFSATLSIAIADPADTSQNNKQLTTAEEEFIVECKLTLSDCYATDKEKCCFPEVIIIDQNDQILAKGERENQIIKNFIFDSDYLTEIQGTEYYRLTIILPITTTSVLVMR